MNNAGKILLTIAFAAASLRPLAVGTPPPSGAQQERIRACSLLTKEEVKKLVPWAPLLDPLPIEEEPVGSSGSSCNYPNVHIQVLTFTPQFLEAARKTGKLEPVTGIGDEAYFHDNAGRFAELYVKVGQRMVTIQKDVDKTSDAEKPGVIALAKALVAKLR